MKECVMKFKVLLTVALLLTSTNALALETVVTSSLQGQSAIIEGLKLKIDQMKIELEERYNAAVAAGDVSDTLDEAAMKAYVDNEVKKVNNRVDAIAACNNQNKLYTGSGCKALPSSSPVVITRNAQGSAYRWGSASVSCPSGYIMVGGGGGCSAPGGYNRMPYNGPSGNGWRIACDNDKDVTSTAKVYVRCMKQ